MKKIVMTVLALLAAWAVISCQKDPEIQKEDNNKQEQQGGEQGGEGQGEGEGEGEGEGGGETPVLTLCINEVNGTDGYKGIEIYNPTDAAVSLVGWIVKKNNEVTDDEAQTQLYWEGVDGVGSIAAKGFYVIHANKKDSSLPEKTEGCVATGGLSASKAVKLELINPEGKTVDTFNRGWDDTAENPEVALKEYTAGSFARATDGGDVWKVLAPTFGATNVGAEVLDSEIHNE